MRIGLRKQLLFVSLLTLALPWAGCQYVQEMESALRTDHEDSLVDGARAVARVLAQQPRLLAYDPRALSEPRAAASDIYAHGITGQVLIDGYPDDWGAVRGMLRGYAGRRAEDNSLTVQAIAASDERYVYFFVRVGDDAVRYLDASRGPHHDRLLLRLRDPNETLVEYVFETAAPGPLRARRLGAGDAGYEAGIRALWQATSAGYQIELRLPRGLIGNRLGFAVIDGDETPADPPAWAGSVDPDGVEVGRLIAPLPELIAEIEDFAGLDRRVWVTDRSGWPLASAGELGLTPDQPDAEGLVASLYRLLLDPELPRASRRDALGRLRGADIEAALANTGGTLWYQRPDDPLAIVAAAAPIVVGGEVIAAVALEQPSAAILTLTNRALTRLVGLTALATALAAVGLLGFATRLSFRIRRLRDATESALTSDGRISTAIPGLGERDEIGDLSRSFAAMLAQLRDHTDYLRSLAGKLSHELRTPLAVVQSSLENLETTGIEGDSLVYARRAADGAQRLRHILVAMSEAARVEQSIDQAERERFDLAALLTGASQGYQDTYPDRSFSYRGPDTPCPFNGVPDLLAQMLDKLVENAVDFTPVGGVIDFTLTRDMTKYTLAVSNEGPPLPAAMQENLFDSMVSMREGKRERPHLGFGLFIAKLIAQFHFGGIAARNLPAGDGVEFVVELPFAQGPR